MTAIETIREKIQTGGLKRGDTLTVGRRLGLKCQWEIFDRSPLTGDVAWMRKHRPGFDQWRNGGEVQIDGVKVFWRSA